MTSVAAQLDAMHTIAKESFEQGDFDSYQDIFVPDLKYRRADGRIVGRDSLIRDARTQFRRYSLTRTKRIIKALRPTDGAAKSGGPRHRVRDRLRFRMRGALHRLHLSWPLVPRVQPSRADIG
jgi:hypothetical protein